MKGMFSMDKGIDSNVDKVISNIYTNENVYATGRVTVE